MIDLLGRHSRDLWNLTFTGKVERLRELLAAEPALAKAAHPTRVDRTRIRRRLETSHESEECSTLQTCWGAPLERKGRCVLSSRA